jgi:uncharacterized protein (TIGR00156 family)
MKPFGLVLAALGVLLTLPLDAAPPTPPPPANDKDVYHLTTVSWVVSTKDDMKVDDRYITLIGRVTKKIDNGSYWFTDGTGTVRLDSDKELPIDSKIVVGGRIDQAYWGFGHLEVDVKQWRYAHKL